MAYFKHPTAIVESDTIGEGTKIWHFVQVREGAKIGEKCIIGKGVYIDTNVEIGDNCKIQNFACVYQGVKIGNNVFIGPHVCFTNDIYPRASLWNEERVAKTILKDGVSIGANATIVAGLTIGTYAMVGAGAVVTKDVPDYGMVLGNPARLKGFVCQCGMTLQEKDKNEEKVTLKCQHCGQEFEIGYEIYQHLE